MGNLVVTKLPAGRPDLANRVTAAARLARKLTGLGKLEFGRRACRLYGVELGDAEMVDLNSGIEGGEIVPSSIGLLVLAETCSLPVGVLLGEPTTVELIARLTARVRVLEALANLPGSLLMQIPA